MEKLYKNEIVSVLLSGPYNKTFDYIIFENTILQIGQIVLVPFGRQEILGMIIGLIEMLWIVTVLALWGTTLGLI